MQYWKSVYPYLNNHVVAEYLERRTVCEWLCAKGTTSHVAIPKRFTNIPPIMKQYLQIHYDDLVLLCTRYRYKKALVFLQHSHMCV